LTKNPSVRAFKCPSCGAPLEPETGTLTMKCSYCGSTVIIPESLRTPARTAGPSMGEVFDFGLRGVDLNKIVGNAMELPQAISLAQQGRVDEAADIYSRITGMEHVDAVAAIRALAAGKAVSLTPGRPDATWGRFETGFGGPTSGAAGDNLTGDLADARGGRRGCGLLSVMIAAVAVVIIGLVAGAVYLYGKGNAGAVLQESEGLLPASFARQSLAFGEEGIGAGMFQDPRSIGVDAKGNITVADFEDGRVQTFDSSGTPLGSFNLSADGQKVYVTSLAVDRDGQIYVPYNFAIHIYDPDGTETGTLGGLDQRYGFVTVGGDGKLYGIADQESIVRFGGDGTRDLEIPKTFADITGDMDINTHMAADGLGNMYIVGSFHSLVLKYSPQGKYVDQFGGETKSMAGMEPGKFASPNAIAVDGYGRIYVSDLLVVQVFDSAGSYIDSIKMDQGVAFGMAFDQQNRLYVVTNQNRVIRYDIEAPSGN
jgi:DNA-directed RNA polymerase subunit RPC12/RpoP